MKQPQKKRAAYLDTALSSDLHTGVIISIGCDRYDSVGSLHGAEADAVAIFKSLTGGTDPLYDPTISKLLRSPSRAEIDSSMRRMLERRKGIGTFLFYFAGHGEMSDGSLYLCPSDTSIEALSVTAINVSQVLRMMCELRPGHAYLIIDACFSGGVGLDLGSILRGEIIDRSPGFGLSILTSTHVLQEAGETPEGGTFTSSLLGAIRGEYLVNVSEPTLGLGDIVGKLEMSPELIAQEPRFWALNISGPDAFCRNPRYEPSASVGAHFGSLPDVHPSLSDEVARRLWRQYLDAPHIDAGTLPDLFTQVIEEQCLTPKAIEATSSAIAGSFAVALEGHEDTFAPALARASMVLALMPHRKSVEARRAMATQIDLIRTAVSGVLLGLRSQLEEDKYYLLGNSGLADLYYLPVRISQLFGWIGFILHGGKPAEAEALRLLTQQLLRMYGNSVVAVGDDQASAYLLFLSQCKEVGWTDEAEEVIGRLYLDFNENFGRVLGNDPNMSDVVDYLLLKASLPLESSATYLQTPSELLSVIMLGAALFDLDEAIDDSLIQLDHKSFSFYVPSSYGDFWRHEMESGRTLIFQLGEGLRAGYGIWSVQDMHRSWIQDVSPLINEARADCSDVDLSAAAIASLVLSDRIAWFAVPPIAARVAIPHRTS